MTQCDDMLPLPIAVDLRSRLLNTASSPCQVGQNTNHEVSATNWGIASYKTDLNSSILDGSITFGGKKSWNAQLILPPASGRPVPVSASEAVIPTSGAKPGDVDAIETTASISPLRGSGGHYTASRPLAIFPTV